MKNISTFQAIFLAVFGVLALGGIFIFSTYSGSSKSKDLIGNVVVWGVLPSVQMNEALDTIKRQNQQLKGVSYISKPQATFETDLSKAIASGQGPDLILVSQNELTSLNKEIIPIPYTALPKRNFLDTFADAAHIYLGPNGVLGIPIAIDPMVLYYNRTMLSSAGIVDPPSTWDAFSGLVPRIAQITNSKNISRALVAFGAYNNVHDAQGILSTLFLQAGVPLVTRSERGGYTVSLGIGNGSGGVKGSIISPGVSVLRFYTEFADPTKVSYTWNRTLPNSRQEFLAGNLALYPGYASEANFITQANPNLSFGVALMPQLATARFKTVYARVYALIIPRGSKNAKGALRTASALSSIANEKIIINKVGFAPSLRSLLAISPQNPIKSVAYTSAIMSHAWLSPSSVTTDKIFSSLIQNIIIGRLSISQALIETKQLIIAALQ